jgi:hypothetical protein
MNERTFDMEILNVDILSEYPFPFRHPDGAMLLLDSYSKMLTL